MKTSIRRSRGVLLAIVVLVLAAGCSTKAGVRVTRDAAADFSQYTTWSWLPLVREDEGPRSDMERKLGEAVQQQIRRELSKRGFGYRSRNADLGIGARLTIQREEHIAHHSSAIETLPTFDNSPAYEIQATRSEVTRCERGRLAIRAMDLRRNREVWRGEYQGPCREAFAPYVSEAVARTLESFPASEVPEPPLKDVARRLGDEQSHRLLNALLAVGRRHQCGRYEGPHADRESGQLERTQDHQIEARRGATRELGAVQLHPGVGVGLQQHRHQEPQNDRHRPGAQALPRSSPHGFVSYQKSSVDSLRRQIFSTCLERAMIGLLVNGGFRST